MTDHRQQQAESLNRILGLVGELKDLLAQQQDLTFTERESDRNATQGRTP